MNARCLRGRRFRAIMRILLAPLLLAATSFAADKPNVTAETIQLPNLPLGNTDRSSARTSWTLVRARSTTSHYESERREHLVCHVTPCREGSSKEPPNIIHTVRMEWLREVIPVQPTFAVWIKQALNPEER